MANLQIPKLVLDPQNEDTLVELAYNRIREASNGALNDFRGGSPIAALVEGQMFGIAELLYYLNMLPEATALETFRLLGVTRSAGTKATGTLRFLLALPLVTDFVINAGYAIPYNDGTFVLSQQLVITAGALEGNVLVEASRVGSDMNVGAFGILITSPGINYLQSIYNPEPISGGTDLEPLVDTITRAQQTLRSRNVIVSQTDYELSAQEVLGTGSRVMCIPFLNSNKTAEAPGHVHLILCDNTGQPPSLGTCAAVKSAIQDKTFAASQVWASPVVLDNLTIELTCGVDSVSEELAEDIAQAVYSYLSPLTYSWGTKVKTNEIAFYARQVQGVNEVDTVWINGQPLDYLLAQKWVSPYPDNVTINLMQPDGVTQTFYKGQGLGDVD